MNLYLPLSIKRSILNKIKSIYYNFKYSSVKFVGPFKSWKEANINSSGYHNEDYFNKVLTNILFSKDIDHIYERDSELVYDKKYPLRIINFINHNFKNKLKVIDFGGSLGSFFFQNKSKIKSKSIKWAIYEQKSLFKIGKKFITHKNVFFFNKMSEIKKLKPHVILFSSVLEYLHNPKKHINDLLKIKSIRFVIIDRLLISNSNIDEIYVQKNPKKYFSMSYPCRIFSKKNFLFNYFKNLKQINTGNSYVGKPFFLNGKKIVYKFFILKVKK